MAFLANMVLENLAAAGQAVPPIYARILGHCYGETPPFAQAWFGNRYRELARDSEWFANSLVANSALEGYGATQIWKFADRLGDQRYAAAVRQHSLDESRHSTMFIRMLELTFPGIAIDAATRDRLQALQPRYSSRHHPPEMTPSPGEGTHGSDAIVELIGVHITEIRALVLQHLLRPVILAYAPPSALTVLTRCSDVLIRDEARHIGYSARFFEEAAADGHADFLFETFAREAAEFNTVTMEELERDKVEI